jgi:pimeloyl-ACP methyl ester carboxylesterase
LTHACRFSIALLLAATAPAVIASPGKGVDPAFEKSECAVKVAPGERIECGVLIVPENRSKPGSRTIRLPVMIFRSTAAAPAPDPVVYLPGGPGLSSMEGRTTGKGNPFLLERDQIVLEGRGNKYASPSLECPEINALRTANGTLAAQTAAAARCRATLTRAGVDLNGYTSEESADDLDDLRRALGIRQWNLIGFSYGTRLAQTVMQRHPEGLRSVVLDSALPLDVNYDETATATLRRAIDALLDDCASDPSCSVHYPDIRSRFAKLVEDADHKGLPTPNRILRGRDVVNALANGLQQPSIIASLPRVINDASNGDLNGLLALTKETPSTFAWGLRLSTWCSEEMPFEATERMDAQLSSSLGLGGIDNRTAGAEMCATWHVDPAQARANAPVASNVPTLILAGEFDPITPPLWGRRLLRTLPNARFVQIPGQSHGAMFNRCGGQMTLAFLRDPSAPLDGDCVAKATGVAFVVGNGASTPAR